MQPVGQAPDGGLAVGLDLEEVDDLLDRLSVFVLLAFGRAPARVDLQGDSAVQQRAHLGLLLGAAQAFAAGPVNLATVATQAARNWRGAAGA